MRFDVFNQTWRRRFFKLSGDSLIAHHDTTLDQRSIIQLSELESIKFLTINQVENIDDLEDAVSEFILEFKDGRSIAFRYREKDLDAEQGRNSWIQSIEESHQILNENQIPDWTIV